MPKPRWRCLEDGCDPRWRVVKRGQNVTEEWANHYQKHHKDARKDND